MCKEMEIYSCEVNKLQRLLASKEEENHDLKNNMEEL